MKVEELEQQALALTESERATLVARLLTTLPHAETDVSDEEVELRDLELESGKIAAISHDEFVRRIGRERDR